MVTNTQAENANEAPAKVFPYKGPVLLGHPNAEDERVRFYTAELPASVCAQFTVERAIASVDGFQRAMDPRRARQIGELQMGERPHIQGGLLAYATEDQVEINSRGQARITILEPLHWLDGQHRGGGDRYAVAHGKDDYTETVRIVVGATREELVRAYLLCNVEARKTTPGNIIANVARMTGVQQRRKSWVCRIVTALAAAEPFVVQDESLVNFGSDRSKPIQAAVLYKAVDLLLPDPMNKEGPMELEAVQYAHEALSLYSDLFGERWGALDEQDRFKAGDQYTFTMMVSFARLWAATEGHEELIRKAWSLAHLTEGLPQSVGTGESAAKAIAALAAGSVGVTLEHAQVLAA